MTKSYAIRSLILALLVFAVQWGLFSIALGTLL